MGNNAVRRFGSHPDAKATGKNSGLTVDPGPYEAVVLAHVKSSRMGELRVSIADFNAPGVDAKDGIRVSYASPFYGATFGVDTQLAPNTPVAAGQSYGMWMVPPDIGNTVLVTFAAGDLNRGYWFACVYDSPSHHMVPGIARNIGGKDKTMVPSDAVGASLSNNSVVPVIEYDTADPDAYSPDALTNTKRYPHEYQTQVLAVQGLDRDPIRGAISSSSLRECPSNVYGISTPGARGTRTQQSSVDPDIVIFRKGGHQFVMDDGAEDGTDQLIRLRTTGGHQILMNDTEHILYIASDTGNQWLEFSKNGAINVYGRGGINMRSEGPMNFHSDSSLTMQGATINLISQGGKGIAGLTNGISLKSMGGIAMTAITTFGIRSNATLSLTCMGLTTLAGGVSVDIGSLGKTSIGGSMLLLNTPPGPGKAIPLPALPPASGTHQDTEYNGSAWVINRGALTSSCTIVPAHEPWVDDSGNRPKPNTATLAASIVSGVL
jgi:hypothetical protein